MKLTTGTETNPLPGVAAALHRAAHRARQVAARTGTPLVFSIKGKIVKRWVNSRDSADLREAFENYLSRVPDAEPPETDRLT